MVGKVRPGLFDVGPPPAVVSGGAVVAGGKYAVRTKAPGGAGPSRFIIGAVHGECKSVEQHSGGRIASHSFARRRGVK